MSSIWNPNPGTNVPVKTELALSTGSGIVGYIRNAIGAVAHWVVDKLSERVSIFDFMTFAEVAAVQARTFTVDCSPAFKLAIDHLVLIGGGTIFCPRGGYLVNGLLGADAYKNGILLPDTNGNFTTNSGITIEGEGVNTELRAGSTNMIIVRSSRLYSGLSNMKLNGNGLAGVIGWGVVPESLTQTTELVSNSYTTGRCVNIENCTEGMLFQPGPTVGGADGGCFYHSFYNMNFNLNTRHIWMKKDITGAGNRVTRTAFYSPIFTRGNTGVQIDGGTEIDFYTPSFEMINSGVSPSLVPTAFNYNDNNPANINLFGGYAEACTIAVKSISPEHLNLIRFQHTATRDTSEFTMGRFQIGKLTVPKYTNTAAYMNLGGEGFVGFAADPDQNGSKTLDLQINGVTKERWAAAGSKTFYGSAGNIITDVAGTTITYSSASGITQVCASSAGPYIVKSVFHGWQTHLGVEIMTLSAAEFIPRQNNTTSFGISGLTWKEVYSNTFRPGTGVAIWTSGVGTPEGAVVAPVGSLYTRTNGGALTTLYIKESGSGNTGWVAK